MTHEGVISMPAREPSSGDIQSVARVCRILALFTDHSALTSAEVARSVELERSTASRYLSSLMREGFLVRESDGSYIPGPALAELGVAIVGGSPVADAGPYMQRLVQEISQTVVLSMWGGDGPVISLVEEDDSRLVHISVRVGSSLPYDAAQSQVFLAHLPDREKVERVLERLPEAARRDLETQMDVVRSQGYAINSRVVEGVRAIAAPVFGRDGEIEATLAVVGTTNAIPQNRNSAIVQALLHTAEQLSWHRGHRPSLDASPRLEAVDGA